MAKKIKIGDEIFSREDIFRKQEEMIRERAKLPFEEKIKVLIRIQRLAKAFGKDLFVWEVEMETEVTEQKTERKNESRKKQNKMEI